MKPKAGLSKDKKEHGKDSASTEKRSRKRQLEEDSEKDVQPIPGSSHEALFDELRDTSEPKLSTGGAKKSNKKKKTKKRRATMDDVLQPTVQQVDFDPSENRTFNDFELDEMILKGVGQLGWEKPTQVQESVIGLALEDKNLMVRARTGSGKTAAFVLPTLQKVMMYATSAEDLPPGPYAIFVAPTKELSGQIFRLLTLLARPFPYLKTLNLTEVNESESAVWERDHPELVVTTPVKLKTMLDIRADFCSHVRHVVLDEADLLLSFGYENEMRFIRSSLPSAYQCIFTSATLSDDMSALKAIFMTGPVLTIKLKEGDLPDATQLTQYHVVVENDEQRFAILLAMFKLKLIVGKTIVFVKNPDRCYQMNLFLWAFKLKSGILNSAMPANSRCHIIDQFNQGHFPIIVASDATHLYGTNPEDESEPSEPKKKQRRMDKEAGVARGIDFHHVSNVINFDFPTTVESYIHRVGRTARGWNKGTALSFCIPKERSHLDTIQDQINEMMGRQVLMPYEIRIKELDSFVLRAREALAACTKNVVKEARLAEIREEALRSAKLQSYFAANPRERDVLASDKKLHTLKVTCPTMADVPDYIVPKALRGTDYNSDQRTKTRNRGARKMSEARKRALRNSKDPLKTFSVP